MYFEARRIFTWVEMNRGLGGNWFRWLQQSTSIFAAIRSGASGGCWFGRIPWCAHRTDSANGRRSSHRDGLGKFLQRSLDLLNQGYEIINASWKPTYVVGGFGGLIHAGSGGCKKFDLADIFAWDKSTFMHWEPGRPVFEDVGPNDPIRGDHQWNATWMANRIKSSEACCCIGNSGKAARFTTCFRACRSWPNDSGIPRRKLILNNSAAFPDGSQPAYCR